MHVEKRLLYPEYDCVIGWGYYFSGVRVKSTGEKKAINLEKQFYDILISMDSLRSDMHRTGSKWLFVLINDKSPYDSPALLDSLRMFDSYVYVKLDENVGCGGKENILQSIGTYYAPRLFRIDADVRLLTPIDPLFEAFHVFPKLGCVTINAGFMGGMLSFNHPNAMYINTAQIGNAVMWDTGVLKEIGCSNPKLRYFDDLDLVYKAKYRGYNSVMVTAVKGRTVSSGCGGTMDFTKQQECARLMEKTNPLISVRLNAKGKPIIRYNKNYSTELFGNQIPKERMSDVAYNILTELIYE